MSKANDSDRYVVPNKDRGGWDVVKERHERASAHADRKKEVVDRAREIVNNLGGGEIRISNKDGKFIDSDTVSGPKHRESRSVTASRRYNRPRYIPSPAARRRVRLMRNKKVFVAFAIEDKRYRDLLRGQSLNTGSPFEYTDFSVKEPFSYSWKTQVRERIRSCDGVIALLSSRVRNADGARWEIKCAVDEGIPIRGVFVSASESYVPPEMSGKRTLRWTWPGIANFIDTL